MKKILAALLGIAVLVGGCSIVFDNDSVNMDTQSYVGASGYSLNIPTSWIMSEETDNKVDFHDEDNQIALSIVSELGGIDYFAMREIKEQLTEELAAQLFSTDYNIEADSGGTKYFRRVLTGADQDGARIVVDMYANQPYLTIRHYLIFAASADAYDMYKDTIENIISSFTTTMTEDEYLQLMEERHQADLEKEKQELEKDKQSDQPSQTPEEKAN